MRIRSDSCCETPFQFPTLLVRSLPILAAILFVLLAAGRARGQCAGDCDNSRGVSINELISCVNVSLGLQALGQCDACDADGDRQVAINEIIASVNAALGLTTCGPAGTVTVGPAGTPTATALPGAITQCCVPAYYVWQCEDRTTADCVALGGVDRGPAVCSAALCADLPPADGHGICCLPNQAGDEIECEDRAASECLAGGGTVKSAGGVCMPDTCADVLPPNPDVKCCLPSSGDDESECEDRSAAQCAAEGGVNMGPGDCAADTCSGAGPNDIQCCVPHRSGTELECEDRTPEECAADGGTNMGPGTCSPDPCNP